MALVFISHSSRDKELVRELADHLNEKGHDVLFDELAIAPGMNWRDKIQDLLRRADVTLVLITEQSVRSDWVIAEASTAQAYVLERGRGAVIPVVLGGAELPPSLAGLRALFGGVNELPEIAAKVHAAITQIFGRQLAEDDRRQDVREKVEAKASDYIRESQSELRSREVLYRRLAHFWYGAAYLALLAGVGGSIWRASLIHQESGEWSRVAELAVIGVVLVGLILAIAKFSFTLAKSYMVEALRNADRSHAISFGEFYLSAFGENLDWKEVKEAFQHWNIDRGSSFLTQEASEFDPKLLENLVELARVLQGANAKNGRKAK